MLKTCTKCKSCKPVADFGKHRKAKDGLSWVCKECNNANSRKWAEANKDRVKRYRQDNMSKLVEQNKWRRYERDFGLTKEVYAAMLEAQNSACALCLGSFGRFPHVDHCHASGKVRGLLCSNCNTALGLVRDRIEVLERMIGYLKRIDEV